MKLLDRIFGRKKKVPVQRKSRKPVLSSQVQIDFSDTFSMVGDQLPITEIQVTETPPTKPALSKIPQLTPVTMSYAQTYSGGRGMYSPAEYDLAEIGVIEDVDGYVAQAFQKKLGLMFKEGFEFVSRNKKLLKYYDDRLAQIARASNIPTSELLRRVCSSLIRVSNAFLVKVRKEDISGGQAHTNANGKTLKPIAAYFPAAPETMRVDIDQDTGKIRGWRHQLPNGNKYKDFPAEDVIHFTINKREGFIFGTPTLIPVIDDIRALRQIEENIELLVYQHLFPLFHYIVGTETAPAGYTESGDREIDIAKREIRYMPSEGGIITPERHEIKILGAENKALRAEVYVEHFKKRVIAGLGISSVDLGEGDCYDATTETLTENGWKLHQNIDHTRERIATYNPKTDRIEFHLPTYKYEGQYVGDMIHFEGKHLDIKVTPHHEMWICPKDNYRKGRNPEWRKVYAMDLLSGKYENFYIMETASFQEQETNPSRFVLSAEKCKRGHHPKPVDCDLGDFASFLGYFISEGCLDKHNGKQGRYRTLISQNIGNKRNQMIDVISRLGLSWSSKQRKNTQETSIRINGKTLYKWLEKNVGHKAKNKNLPREVFAWSKEIRQKLLDALILGDGTVSIKTNPKGFFTYYTTSRQLSDDVQTLALSLGLRAKVVLAKQNPKSYGGEVYRVYISNGNKRKGFRLVNQSMISKENYSGEIYCYNVPNHLFVTRRNGKVAIQGNTANRATANTMSRALIDTVKSIQDQFEAQWDQEVTTELMLESKFGDEVFVDDEFPELKFNEIDIDKQIEQDKHSLELFKGYAITFSELRERLSLPPIDLPEDPEDQDPTKYPEWYSTFWKLIEEPSLLIRAVDEPYSLPAQALAKSKGSTTTQGDIGVATQSKEKETATELEAEKETKIAVAKAKPRPPVRKDSFLTSSYADLEADTIQMLLVELEKHRFNKEDYAAHFNTWASFIRNKFLKVVHEEVIRGFSSQAGGSVHLASDLIQHGKAITTSRVEKFLSKFTHSLLDQLDRKLRPVLETEANPSIAKEKVLEELHASFAAHTYRLDFALSTETQKAYGFGKLLGMRYQNFDNITYSAKETACNICRAFDGQSLAIGHVSIEDITPHHPGCKCGMIPTKKK